MKLDTEKVEAMVAKPLAGFRALLEEYGLDYGDFAREYNMEEIVLEFEKVEDDKAATKAQEKSCPHLSKSLICSRKRPDSRCVLGIILRVISEVVMTMWMACIIHWSSKKCCLFRRKPKNWRKPSRMT